MLAMTSFKSIFAFSLADSFNTVFGSNGLGGLLGSPEVLYFFYFLVIFLSAFQLFKILMKAISFPEKAANVIAFMISFIGSTGIFYMFGSNQEALINFFGGLFGFIIIFALLAFVAVPLVKKTWKSEDTGMPTKIFYILLIVTPLLIILNTFLEESGGIFGDNVGDLITELIGILAALLVLFGIFFLLGFLGKKSYDRKKEVESNPSIVKVRENLRQINSSVNSIDNELKSISEVLK